jgi:hypothetical protein
LFYFYIQAVILGGVNLRVFEFERKIKLHIFLLCFFGLWTDLRILTCEEYSKDWWQQIVAASTTRKQPKPNPECKIQFAK